MEIFYKLIISQAFKKLWNSLEIVFKNIIENKSKVDMKNIKINNNNNILIIYLIFGFVLIFNLHYFKY